MILFLQRLKLSQNRRYNVARDQEHSQKCVFISKNSAPMHTNVNLGVKFPPYCPNLRETTMPAVRRGSCWHPTPTKHASRGGSYIQTLLLGRHGSRGLGFPLPNEISSLFQQFPELLTPHFHHSTNKHGVEHHIVTHGPQTHARALRLDLEKLSAAKSEFVRMEEMGIVRRSKSVWSSSFHIVPKSDGTWRPCGDYRRLNASTDDDRYPLRHIQDFNNHLAGCRVFSKIDLIKRYHQVPMAPSSIAKTAVVTSFGLWEFLRMTFGLKNAAQSFQRLMNGVLRGVPFAFAYLDDIS
ncbi:polyprotein [Plakobranchus ocellatus]|uniref:Polyprotein n=1 Tax=Plakobranchus ocellatus TaxID=259542 RepID=A0AAV4C2Z2_9GAST|nr:polyprotein [Plakobranchus ocellatus]